MIIVGLLDPMCVGLSIVGAFCLLCDKFMQAIMLFSYVILMVVFYTVETKGKIRKIKEMSDLDQNIKIFRRNQNQSNIFSIF